MIQHRKTLIKFIAVSVLFTVFANTPVLAQTSSLNAALEIPRETPVIPQPQRNMTMMIGEMQELMGQMHQRMAQMTPEQMQEFRPLMIEHHQQMMEQMRQLMDQMPQIEE